MVNPHAKLLSVPEFSERLGVTRACTWRWILERKIAYIKVFDRLVGIPETDLERILSEGLRPRREVKHD
jgi:excisionase family DNA binding protein